MLVMLVSGSCNTIVMKAQDKVEVGAIPGYIPEDGKKNVFKHAYFQSANTFVGEFSCLIVWMIKRLYAKMHPTEELRRLTETGSTPNGNELIRNSTNSKGEIVQENLKTSINILWLAIPAFFDVSGCTLMFVAL